MDDSKGTKPAAHVGFVRFSRVRFAGLTVNLAYANNIDTRSGGVIMSVMPRFSSSRRRPYIFGVVVGLAILGTLLISAALLNASQYAALASTIQAIAVVPAIAIAAIALTADSHDKRVDRVLDFHKEFNSGEVLEATVRLGAHLRDHGKNGKVRPVDRDELVSDPVLSKYNTEQESTPRADAGIILRFFDRANAARVAQTVDLPLMAELIGRNAAWWNKAIIGPGSGISRTPLRDLANWADEFALKNRDKYPYLEQWGEHRGKEFEEGPS